jgi:hypothetical protein
MDDPGVTARPFKGKKRKVVSLTSCQTEPRFQDAIDVVHVSVVVTVSLGLNSLPPLFLTISDVMVKNVELCRVPEESRRSR